MSGRLVLVRHGQSHGNVDRRLDTRPPGAALTDLGHEQARTFAVQWPHPVGMVAHSVALRATETAADIGAELGLPTLRLEGIHEVQVGDLENRNDDEAVERVQLHLPALAGRRARRADARRRERARTCWTATCRW